MAVKNCGQRKTVQRLLQPATTHKWKDVHRLSLDGRLDWRVMGQGNAVFRPQPGEGTLQLQSFFDRFVHELLDDVLAPGSQSGPAETADKALDAGEADAVDFAGVAVEDGSAAVRQDLLN